jgi:hypothetical protein
MSSHLSGIPPLPHRPAARTFDANKSRAGKSRTGEHAETLAVAALSFLAADPERLSRFLSLSGLDIASLRQAAAQEGFLAGVMAHLAADEALLMEFAAASGRAPEQIAAACQSLNPGFD